MRRKLRDIFQREARDVRTQAEAADQATDTCQPEWCDDTPRPVRYLWPALSSLWEAGCVR